MKQIKTLAVLSILTIAVLSCRKEDVSYPTKGSIEFSFTLSTTKSTNTDPAAPVAVIISVEDLNGQSVYKNEQVAIESTGNIYNSKALEFEAGFYHLTKFQVIDANGSVLNATPMGFSANASLVSNPLPIKFSIQDGYTTKISPEILSAQNSNPQAFGYSSFNINQTASYMFRIGAYIFNSGTKQFELSGAQLTIKSDAGETVTKSLATSIDSINIKEANSYILSVSKDGYQTWVDTVSTADLVRYFTSPYKATLDLTGEENFSFTTNQDTLTKVSLTLNNTNGSAIQVNWGDGNIEVYTANAKLAHDYKYMGVYKAKISGAISTLTGLVATNCKLATINLSQATGLTSIDLSRNQWLKSLNLSSMPSLKEIVCVQGGLKSLVVANCQNVESVYCSLNNLTSIDVSTLTKLKNLYCDRNNLDNLNISSNLNLAVLYCYQNNLTTLDVKNNIALTTLDCRSNQLSFVDISQLKSITNLLFGNNTINNDNANKILVDLYNNVKSSPRSGQISISVSVKGDGLSAKNNLVSEFKWNVSTY